MNFFQFFRNIQILRLLPIILAYNSLKQLIIRRYVSVTDGQNRNKSVFSFGKCAENMKIQISNTSRRIPYIPFIIFHFSLTFFLYSIIIIQPFTYMLYAVYINSTHSHNRWKCEKKTPCRMDYFSQEIIMMNLQII